MKHESNIFHLNTMLRSLSGNESNRVIHDKNSISILKNSCAKSNCHLEFELKIKGQQLTIIYSKIFKYVYIYIYKLFIKKNVF